MMMMMMILQVGMDWFTCSFW